MRQVIKVLVIMQDNCERDSSKELERSMKPTLPFPCMFQVVADNFVAFDVTRMQLFDVIVIPQKTTEPFSVSTFIEILKTADGYVPAFIYLMEQSEDAKAIKHCKGRHVRYSHTGNIPIVELSQAIQALVEPDEVSALTVTAPLARGPSQVSPLTFFEAALPARSGLHVPRPSPKQFPEAPAASARIPALAVPVRSSAAAQAASVQVSPSPRPRIPVPKRQRSTADVQQENSVHPSFRNYSGLPVSQQPSSFMSMPRPRHASEESHPQDEADVQWHAMQRQAQQQFQNRYNPPPSVAQRVHQQAPHYRHQYPPQSYQYPPHHFSQAPPANHVFAPVQARHRNTAPNTAPTQAPTQTHTQAPQMQRQGEDQANSHARIPIVTESGSPPRPSAPQPPLPSPASWLDGLDLDHHVLDQLYNERF